MSDDNKKKFSQEETEHLDQGKPSRESLKRFVRDYCCFNREALEPEAKEPNTSEEAAFVFAEYSKYASLRAAILEQAEQLAPPDVFKELSLIKDDNPELIRVLRQFIKQGHWGRAIKGIEKKRQIIADLASPLSENAQNTGYTQTKEYARCLRLFSSLIKEGKCPESFLSPKDLDYYCFFGQDLLNENATLEAVKEKDGEALNMEADCLLCILSDNLMVRIVDGDNSERISGTLLRAFVFGMFGRYAALAYAAIQPHRAAIKFNEETAHLPEEAQEEFAVCCFNAFLHQPFSLWAKLCEKRNCTMEQALKRFALYLFNQFALSGNNEQRKELQTTEVDLEVLAAFEPKRLIKIKAITAPNRYRAPTNDYRIAHQIFDLTPGESRHFPINSRQHETSVIKVRSHSDNALIGLPELHVLFATVALMQGKTNVIDLAGTTQTVVTLQDIIKTMFTVKTHDLGHQDTRYQFVKESLEKLLSTRYDFDIKDFILKRKILDDQGNQLAVSRYIDEPLISGGFCTAVSSRGKEYECISIYKLSVIVKLYEWTDQANTSLFYRSFMPENIKTKDAIYLCYEMLERAFNHGMLENQMNHVYLSCKDIPARSSVQSLFQSMKRYGWIDYDDAEPTGLTSAQRQKIKRQRDKVLQLLDFFKGREEKDFSVRTNIDEENAKSRSKTNKKVVLTWYWARCDRKKTREEEQKKFLEVEHTK